MGTNPMTVAQVTELWDRYAAGDTAAVIARKLCRPYQTVNDRIREAGGVRPTIPKRSDKQLSLADREEISRGLAAGESLRRIAGRLGRAPSTVSREVERNGGAGRYRAGPADHRAMLGRRRPKSSKLATCPALRARWKTSLR